MPNADILAVMPPGAEVGILGDQQNGFYPIRYQNQDGWAGAEFLSLDGQQATSTSTSEPEEPTATATTRSRGTRRRSDRPGGYDLRGELPGCAVGRFQRVAGMPANTLVDIMGEPQNGFYPVRFQDQDGWVSGEFLDLDGEVETATTEATATATSEPTQGPTSTPTAQLIDIPDEPVGNAVTTSEVNMRDGASSNANITLVLPAGAALDLLGDPDNGFYPVMYQQQARLGQ